MAVRMQQRRGTSEQWSLANPVLSEGEIGWESDTNTFKIGDGVNRWQDLSAFVDTTNVSASLDEYTPLTLLGTPEGVATLDVTGNVPSEQLGNVPVTDLTGYATEIYADSVADTAYDNAVTTANSYTDTSIAAIPAPDFTGYATETYVDTAVAGLVDSAPATLDTLNELAAALGDDANFATTVTTALSKKAPKTNPEFTIETLTPAYEHTYVGYIGVAPDSGFTIIDGWGASNLLSVNDIVEITNVSGMSGVQLKIEVVNDYGEQNRVYHVSLVDSANQSALDAFASSPWPTAISYSIVTQSSLNILDIAKMTQDVVAKTSNYTLTSSDRASMVTCSGTFTITIPSGVFSAGDRVDFVNIGTGVITFAGSGVTVNSVDAAVTIDTQWAGATFFFTSPTAGVLIGKLA